MTNAIEQMEEQNHNIVQTQSTQQLQQQQPLLLERPLCFGCEDNWTWNKRDRSQEVR